MDYSQANENLKRAFSEVMTALSEDERNQTLGRVRVHVVVPNDMAAIANGYGRAGYTSFNRGGTRDIYLSTDLAGFDMATIRATIAHELAHALLGSFDENTADAQAARWGFVGRFQVMKQAALQGATWHTST